MDNLSGDFTGLIQDRRKKKAVVIEDGDQETTPSISDKEFRNKIAKILSKNQELKTEILELYSQRKAPELYSAEICTKQLSTLLNKLN